MAPLFYVIFGQAPHRLTKEAIEAWKYIGHWHMETHYTYIRVLGCSSPSQLLPKYVPDWLIIYLESLVFYLLVPRKHGPIFPFKWEGLLY